VTAQAADLVERVVAVAERLRDVPGRISALVISVQRLRGPVADPHSPRRREAFQGEVRALIDDSWALSLEVGHLAEATKATQGATIGRPPEEGG